jgi:hypothetical protein
MAANGVTCSVYGSGKVKGADFNGIPHVFLFSHTGENTYEGHWTAIESNVADLCKAAPDWLTGPKNWTKVKPEADKIRSRKGMGPAVAELRKKEQAEGDAKEEAGELLDRVTKYAEREMKRADGAVEVGDPLKAQEIWSRLSKEFKGDEIGTQADAVAKEKGQDPAFQKEVEAGKQLAKLEAAAKALKPRGESESPAKWREKNAGAIGQILGLYKSMEKKYGDTKVFVRAKAKVGAMGVE